MSWGEAERMVGTKVIRRESVYPIVLAEQHRNAAVAQMTREKVMNGFLEAIEMARIQADPKVMINGWTEIGRMCGYYAPELKRIDISLSAKRMVDKFETMSDEELLQYAEKQALTFEGSTNQEVQDVQPDVRETGERDESAVGTASDVLAPVRERTETEIRSGVQGEVRPGEYEPATATSPGRSAEVPRKSYRVPNFTDPKLAWLNKPKPA